ncbi:predicted protein [Verticillium alfalfae VaMs.102]|uniref:Predicted protein n=1 Tax=Verticillium alfalfae (strain VaMs.102 / ATCC MYA-4576 / FGSC 10136) TaxID=526221 RepID=C9SWR8_VERA1|nr:predicted protein [Verticillium alfalfae VaMs.102]EEY23459.1 predicted protein [Verticillium alfalfae VaMs.102]
MSQGHADQHLQILILTISSPQNSLPVLDVIVSSYDITYRLEPAGLYSVIDMSDVGTEEERFYTANNTRNESFASEFLSPHDTSKPSEYVLFTGRPSLNIAIQSSQNEGVGRHWFDKQRKTFNLTPRPRNTILCSLICNGQPEDCV